MSKEEFLEELQKIGIIPTKEQLEKLDIYYKLLIEYNQHINLTRITEEKEVYLKHYYDSLTIVKVIDLNKISTLLDFGTGAGFPGIVLKIMYPNLNITLVDSLQKRVKFLNIVIEKLNLKNIEAIHERVENIKLKHYDIITTRAVANLSKLLDYTHNLIDSTTLFIPLKGNVEEELIDAEKKLKKYKLKINKKEKFYLPNENSARNILVITKC
ncbi:MAG: 16S rRNA (guanine(527)-N(7))-methyltransferase RsmG [Bacilli bacterium]|nr:16S rRNA (guanine(527)-N(7))-methyltransferase RsmG [Bacilli bacterium]